MLRELVLSDDAVKAVFDHFRNIGIAGAVLAVGVWSLTHRAAGLLVYMSWASGLALCVLGSFLFIVAERHGQRKFKDLKLSVGWEFIARLVYGLSLVSLFTAAVLRIELH